MNIKECQMCEYYFMHDPAKNVGFCRRYPPQVFKMVSSLGTTGLESRFPPVNPKSGCGEFSPRITIQKSN
jgi:hypothetical protein